MVAWIRGGLSAFASALPTALVLFAMAALAWWGHRYGWQAPSLARLTGAAPDEGPEDEPKRAEVAKVSSPAEGAHPLDRAVIRLLTADAADKAGLAFDRAREESWERVVRGHAELDYDPLKFARLAPRAGGTVWRILRKPGQQVKAGDTLALLDAAAVGRAKGDYLEALVLADLKTQALERTRTAGGALPERELRAAEAQVREARTRLFAQQQALLNLGLPAPGEDVGRLPLEELTERVRLLGLPEEVTKDLNPRQATANLLPVSAPFAGEVVAWRKVQGEAVAEGDPIFDLADTTNLTIEIGLRLEDSGDVRVGQVARFRPDERGPGAEGTVGWVSPEVEEKTRRVRVRATVPNLDGKLRPHTFGTGEVVVRPAAPTVVVPEEAVQGVGGTDFLFVKLGDAEYQARAVGLGARRGGKVEVATGVRAGEEVVVSGAHVLKAELAGAEE